MEIELLIANLNAAFFTLLPLVLNLVFALLLLLIGLLIAKGLEYLIILVLKAVQLDNGAKQIGFDDLLKKGAVRKTLSELLGSLVYWIVIFVAVIGVFNFLGLPLYGALINIFAYVGVVFLAALILGVGVFLAGLIAGIVRIVMANLGLDGAAAVSRVIYYIVIVFTFLAALAEMGFSLQMLAPHIGIILGFPALAAAIAFGLGCKDMAADFLHNLFKGK